MAEHIMDVEQYMNLTSPHRLNEATGYVDGTVKKTTEITLCPQL
jgi:hypothetical protein